MWTAVALLSSLSRLASLIQAPRGQYWDRPPLSLVKGHCDALRARPSVLSGPQRRPLHGALKKACGMYQMSTMVGSNLRRGLHAFQHKRSEVTLHHSHHFHVRPICHTSCHIRPCFTLTCILPRPFATSKHRMPPSCDRRQVHFLKTGAGLLVPFFTRQFLSLRILNEEVCLITVMLESMYG
ncbi:hypothetical protein IW261DRAFT_43940 [Armillaria novae-zelandiae]|uniref:Secreted protein n=1 Tax=Armillaria novae-zelandiae TaxID=153914 RepID=A0AA39PUK7_9AGAR|nr:hypothetical protein IW261DRAFT_43940 [Armillaria novae-zelandiae]